MSWTYAAWEEQSTPEAQLAMLKQWRTELRDAISLGVTGNGHSVNSSDVRQTLRDSQDDLTRLQAQVDSRAGTNRPLVVTTAVRTPRRPAGLGR